MIKKIKRLLAHFQVSQNTPLMQSNNDFGMKTKGMRVSNRSKEVSQPITSKIIAWIDSKKWVYNHRSSDKGDIHHLILGFTNSHEEDWTCAFCINEKIKVVTMFGIPEYNIPVSHYTAVLIEITKANLDMGFGNFEFDLDDGEVRVKVAFDLEFGVLTDKVLEHYFSLLLALTNSVRTTVETALEDSKPSQLVDDYIKDCDIDNEIRVRVDDESWIIFTPTDVIQ